MRRAAQISAPLRECSCAHIVNREREATMTHCNLALSILHILRKLLHTKYPQTEGPPKRSRMFGLALGPVALMLGLTSIPAVAAKPSFIAFESGPVRPIAKSPDGSRL